MAPAPACSKWRLDYPAAAVAVSPEFARPAIDERNLLTINYASGTTARPKGVMITHVCLHPDGYVEIRDRSRT